MITKTVSAAAKAAERGTPLGSAASLKLPLKCTSLASCAVAFPCCADAGLVDVDASACTGDISLSERGHREPAHVLQPHAVLRQSLAISVPLVCTTCTGQVRGNVNKELRCCALKRRSIFGNNGIVAPLETVSSCAAASPVTADADPFPAKALACTGHISLSGQGQHQLAWSRAAKGGNMHNDGGKKMPVCNTCCNLYRVETSSLAMTGCVAVCDTCSSWIS